MSGGRIVHETPGAQADRYEIGRHMADDAAAEAAAPLPRKTGDAA
mgnify:FL=1